jgi:hypothetical protein
MISELKVVVMAVMPVMGLGGGRQGGEPQDNPGDACKFHHKQGLFELLPYHLVARAHGERKGNLLRWQTPLWQSLPFLVKTRNSFGNEAAGNRSDHCNPGADGLCGGDVPSGPLPFSPVLAPEFASAGRLISGGGCLLIGTSGEVGEITALFSLPGPTFPGSTL